MPPRRNVPRNPLPNGNIAALIPFAARAIANRAVRQAPHVVANVGNLGHLVANILGPIQAPARNGNPLAPNGFAPFAVHNLALHLQQGPVASRTRARIARVEEHERKIHGGIHPDQPADTSEAARRFWDAGYDFFYSDVLRYPPYSYIRDMLQRRTQALIDFRTRMEPKGSFHRFQPALIRDITSKLTYLYTAIDELRSGRYQIHLSWSGGTIAYRYETRFTNVVIPLGRNADVGSLIFDAMDGDGIGGDYDTNNPAEFVDHFMMRDGRYRAPPVFTVVLSHIPNQAGSPDPPDRNPVHRRCIWVHTEPTIPSDTFEGTYKTDEGELVKLTMKSSKFNYAYQNNCGIIAVNELLGGRLEQVLGRKYCTFMRSYLVTNGFCTSATSMLPLDVVTKIYDTFISDFNLQNELPPTVEIVSLPLHLPHDIILQAVSKKVALLTYHNYHLTAVTKIELMGPEQYMPRKEVNKVVRWYSETQEGKVYLDFETFRDTEYKLAPGTFMHRDTIACIRYKNGREKDWKDQLFETQEFGGFYYTSARKFLDWLLIQPCRYRVYCHNGSGFDFHFLINAMSDHELHRYVAKKEKFLRTGLSTILQFTFYGHVFIDTFKFMTCSLAKACKSFIPHLPEFWKQTKVKFEHPITLEEVELSTEELCFFLSDTDVTFAQWLNLHSQVATIPTRKTFWEVYVQYCFADCKALQLTHMAMENTDRDLLGRLKEFLPFDVIKRRRFLAQCSVRYAVTLGQQNMTIFKKMNQHRPLYRDFQNARATGAEQREMVRTTMIGGMSIINFKGIILDGVMVYDAKSLYPAALKFGLFPGGKATLALAPRYLGWANPALYRLTNIKFDTLKIDPMLIRKGHNVPYNSYVYRPVLERSELVLTTIREDLRLRPTERTWLSAIDCMHEVYTTTIMIEFLKRYMGLLSFDVEEALVWNKWISGEEMFGPFVNTCYSIKMEQDVLEQNKDPAYNSALRTKAKEGLNSLIGKFSQTKENQNETVTYFNDPEHPPDPLHLDPSRQVALASEPELVDEERQKDHSNQQIFTYDNSKMRMFIPMIHFPVEDFVAMETDSIHIRSRSVSSMVQRTNTVMQTDPWIVSHPSLSKCFNVGLDPETKECTGFDMFRELLFEDEGVTIGRMTLESVAEYGMYVKKKGYALYITKGKDKDKWKMRMSGFSMFGLTATGTWIPELTPDVYMDACMKSLQFQEWWQNITNSEYYGEDINKLMGALETQYQVSQTTSKLIRKFLEGSYIFAGKHTKSILPALGMSITGFSDNSDYQTKLHQMLTVFDNYEHEKKK